MNNMKASKGYRAFQCINTVIMILVIFVTLYPFIYLVARRLRNAKSRINTAFFCC